MKLLAARSGAGLPPFGALFGLIAYAIMVGGSASVVRATIMGILLLWAEHIGRPYAAPNALFASGMLMTFFDPNTLFDVGFQLSFVATLVSVMPSTSAISS